MATKPFKTGRKGGILAICWLTRSDINLARIDVCGNGVCGDLELVSLCGCGVVVR